MQKNKKLLIGFWTAIAAVIGLVIALVAVLAAFNASVTTSVKINYTASGNLKAEITGSYKLANGDATNLIVEGTDADTVITFGTGTGATATASFKDIENIGLDSENTYVTFTYVIKNTKTTEASFVDSFNAKLNIESSEDEHISIKLNGTEIEDGEHDLGAVASSNAEGLIVTIEFSVNDVTANVENFEATLSFNLAA